MKIMIVYLLLLTSLSGFAQEKKRPVAVLELVSSGKLDRSEIITLTKRFRDMLVQTDVFNVLERDKMDAVLKEQDFILSDNCNSAECAVQVGQLLGVEAVITGDIGKIGEIWTVSLRLINMTTGKIEKAETMDYQGKIEGLLDVMHQIAYIFAGLNIPTGKSAVVYKNSFVQSPPIPPHMQGRLKFELLGGKGLNQENKSLTGDKVEAGNIGISIGYMVTPRFRTGIEFSLHSYFYKDTVAWGDGGGQASYEARPTVTAYGINLSYYLSSGRFKPFIKAGIGYQSFKDKMVENKTPLDTKTIEDRKKINENTSGLYGSAMLGMDIRLFRSLDFSSGLGLRFDKPFSVYSIHVGFVFSMGEPFPVTKN